MIYVCDNGKVSDVLCVLWLHGKFSPVYDKFFSGNFSTEDKKLAATFEATANSFTFPRHLQVYKNHNYLSLRKVALGLSNA